MTAVPVVDIAPFLHGDREARRRVAAEIDQVCRDIGFLCIAGHGVPDEAFDEIYHQSKAFFHLPLEEKRRVGQRHPHEIRGYIGYGVASLSILQGEESPPDLKESLNAGPVDVDYADPYYTAPESRFHFAPNQWPERPEGLGEAWRHYYRTMEALSADLMRLFATALDLPEDYFAPAIDRQTGILGAMYYPDQPTPPAPGQLRSGAHTDFGTLTVLRPDSAPGGLQVQGRDGQWVPVRAPKGTFVMNIGDLMAQWTNDRWVSTLHRVVNPPRDTVLGTERLSIGFFHQPNYDALVECLPSCRSADRPAKYPAVLAGEYSYGQFSRQVLEEAS